MARQQETALNLEKARVRDLLRYYTPTAKPDKKLGSLLDIVCDEAESPVPTSTVAAEIKNGSNEGELGETEIVNNGEVLVVCEQSTAVAAIADENNKHVTSFTPPDFFPLANASTDEADDDPPDDTQLLAHDPTLMAFTQLGAFRTNCQRSFISLMDDKKQYIIAEATRSVSLSDPNVYDQTDPGEKVYLGPRILDQNWGVCPNTIQVFTSLDDSLNVSTGMVTANQTCYVMNDLSAIPAYADRPYVSGWPYMRFYAEVPIRSPTGYVIGTYCVVDNKPREGLDMKGLDALNEIATAIMKHLALVRSQYTLQRAGQMVRGLGKFVEGKTGASTTSSDDRRVANLEALEKRTSSSRIGTAETLPTLSTFAVVREEETAANFQPAESSLTRETSVVDLPSRPGPAPFRKSVSSRQGGEVRSRERKLSLDGIMHGPDSIAALGTKLLFARASTLIRDAIDLDGIVFVDASFHDVSSAATQGVSRAESRGFYGFKGTPQTPDTDRSEWLIESSRVCMSPASPADSDAGHGQTSSSDVLGHALRSDLVLGGASPLSQQVPLSKSTLRGCLRYYRQGKIFEFEEDGTLIQNSAEIYHDDRGNDVSKDFRARERLWAKQLLSICSGANSIIFFPLWDPQRDQWFSGSMAWTNSTTRILGADEITYLSAFGSCIMAEKSRLDAVNADRAKSDFISSVSHELRSPLHGVLASVEALQESSTGPTQDDMIRTIKICGEVLLDTMDQILDYAKMSKKSQPLELTRAPLSSRDSVSQQSKSICIDLGCLVESTIEGIYAGHSYKKATHASTDVSSTQTISLGDVMVILTIEWRQSWVFESQIGGWKRIIVNLVGNSLKYTESGFVRVILQAKTGIGPSPETTILLQIEDSGKGMSKEYMKYQLYTPFAQEDQWAVGTGLGLSIVRQLVTDLGGKIDIQSEKGCGTTVKVAVPLKPSSDIPEMHYLEASSIIADVGTRCKGLTLCLVRFEYYPDVQDTPTEILSSQSKRMLATKSSITSLATDWFGMNISTAADFDSADGDIMIRLQSKLDMCNRAWEGRPMIILDDGSQTRHEEQAGIFHLPQPVGPYKLARVLGQCLNYKASAQNIAIALDTPPIQPAELTMSITPPTAASIETTNQLKTPNTILCDSDLQKVIATTVLTPQIDTIVAASEARRSKVLLVEDNIINMKILVNFMKRAKQEYVTATNGLEAFEQYQDTPDAFKVIFMDISMPVMDGLTSAREIRQFERQNGLARTRIVALTCFSSEDYQRDAALIGFDMYLIKPVPMSNLKPILEMPH